MFKIKKISWCRCEFFKYGNIVLVDHLTVLFNRIFASGYYPSVWAKSILQLLHKGGSTCDLNNFRDISLLSVFGKLFCTVLNNRLKFWQESNNIFCQEQAGFRAGFCTGDNIFILQGLIYNAKVDGKNLYLAFVDFSKAFNSIFRYGLWYKLIRLGCSGKLFKTIFNLYSKITCSVRTSEGLTDSFLTKKRSSTRSSIISILVLYFYQ